jgi:chaperonin GroEL
VDALVAALDQTATAITGKEQTALMARGMCQEDQEMANVLGEIFDIVGPDGLIIVEPGHRYELEREYIEGTYWHLSGWLSRWFVQEKADNRTTFEDAALLISDFSITEPGQLVPALDKCVKAGVKRLIILAKNISDSAIGLLMTNNQAKTIETMAVRAPKVGGQEQVNAIEDIAVLTGGRAFHADGKDSFENFRIEDLGYARRAWAAESMFGLFGGKGDPRQIRQRIATLRAQLPEADVKNERKNLQQRLGRLTGATALLKVGGISATEIETRKETAERAITALRKSLQGGVVAGGGAALLNLQSALEGLPAPQVEYAQAYKILARTLEEPMRVIAYNSGCNPDVIVEKVKAMPKEYGLDGRTRQIIDMRQAGILDAVLVLRQALEIGVRSAALALTTDVIIHHKKPEVSVEP